MTSTGDIWRAIGVLRADLAAAQRRISELESMTPAALAAQLEADLAAADLAESGYCSPAEVTP